MTIHPLAGRCGLYCGSCAVFRADKDGGDYRKRVSVEWELPLEEVRCEGCHGLTDKCRGNVCEIVRCHRSKGYEFCYECTEHAKGGCDYYRRVANNAMRYGIDVRANLEMIKSGNMDRWLNESKELSECPQCGKPLPRLLWTEKECYHCHAKLEKDLDKREP